MAFLGGGQAQPFGGISPELIAALLPLLGGGGGGDFGSLVQGPVRQFPSSPQPPPLQVAPPGPIAPGPAPTALIPPRGGEGRAGDVGGTGIGGAAGTVNNIGDFIGPLLTALSIPFTGGAALAPSLFGQLAAMGGAFSGFGPLGLGAGPPAGSDPGAGARRGGRVRDRDRDVGRSGGTDPERQREGRLGGR